MLSCRAYFRNNILCYLQHWKRHWYLIGEIEKNIQHLHSWSVSSLLGRVFSALDLLLCPWNLVQFDGIRKSNNPQTARLFRVLHWLAAFACFCRIVVSPSCANIAVSSCARFDAFQSHRVFSVFHPLLRV